MTFSDEDLEELGRLVDTLDNNAYSAKLPLPDKMHKEALLLCVASARDVLKGVLVRNGYNPWSDA